MNTITSILVYAALLVFTVGFLMIVLSVVPAINQLRVIMRDLEKSIGQINALTARLNNISAKVEVELDKIDLIIDSSKATVETISDSLRYVNINILKRTSGILAFIPAVKFGWKLVKKLKGGK
ncbi:MAG: hypothetical protein MUF15_16095 [Acidobacteria bacterium]|jgi:predicted PurR-regulated permease PerM|nr:hypothetical protein [Acidobacteriota bacterium]